MISFLQSGRAPSAGLRLQSHLLLLLCTHTLMKDGADALFFPSPTSFRIGLPSITLTAICSRIFHMALRWKTLWKQGGARHWGNRKVLPDPNSDPDKNSFLPLSCSLSSGLELGNKAGRGARTLSLARPHVPEKQPLAVQQQNWLSEGITFQRQRV